MSSPGDIKFLQRDRRRCATEAGKLRRQAPTSSWRSLIPTATWTTPSCARASSTCCCPATTMTSPSAIDGKTVMVESNEEGNFVTAIDFVAQRHGRGQGPQGGLVAELPRSRFLDRRPRPGGRWRSSRRYEDELVEGTRCRDRHLEERTRQPLGHRCARRKPPSETSSPTRSGIRTGADVAITNGGGIRANKQYPAGAKLTRRDILSELPFGKLDVAGRGDGRRYQRGAGKRRVADRESRRPLPAGLRPEVRGRPEGPGRRAGRNVTVNGAAARPGQTLQGRDEQLHAGGRRRLCVVRQGQGADRATRTAS